MKWRVEEYENACSQRSVRVRSDDGEIIADNEPYYPEPLDPKHAHLIAAAPSLLENLKRMLLEFDFMVEGGHIPDHRNDIVFVDAREAVAAAEVTP